MSAPSVRSAVLLGPVACIGCAPAPIVPSGPAFADSSGSRYMVSGGTFVVAQSSRKAAAIGQLAPQAVRDSCRADIHLSSLRVHAFAIWALALYWASVEVELEAAPVEVPAGVCWVPAP
jgi:hypothetical protein